MQPIRYCVIFFTALLCSSPNWAAQSSRQVVLQTNLGNIVIELFPREAPITVKNFLEYIDSGFYDGTIFHRVAPGFIIQGGGFDASFTSKKTRAPIKSESYNGLSNNTYMVSMAHLPNSDLASSQFFINLQSNTALNSNSKSLGYTVFGKVIEGMDVAEKISLEPRGMYETLPEAPNTSVEILKATRVEVKRGEKTDNDTPLELNDQKSIKEKSVSTPE